MKLEKKVYTERAEKRKDFMIGVGIFIGLNIALLLVGLLIYLGLIAAEETIRTLLERLDAVLLDTVFRTTLVLMGSVIQCLTALPLLINLGVMIIFTLTRPWIALGMVAVLGALFLLAFIFGCVLSMIYFSGLVASGG